MAFSSVSISSAWSWVMPSGILMVTASALTVLEAAAGFGLADAAMGAGGAFEVLPVEAGGVLCPAATKLPASTNHPIRLPPIVLRLAVKFVASPLAPKVGMSGDPGHRSIT